MAIDALDEPDVGEGRRGDGVADRPHAGLAGAADVVDLDEPALVDLHRGAVEAEVVGVGLPADRHDDDVDVEAPRRRPGRWCPSRVGEWPSTLASVRMSMPRPLKLFSMTLVTSLSRPGRIFGQRLEDRDLGAEVGEQRGELAADHAAADDGGALRQLADREELVGRHHDLAVDVEARQRARHRARAPARRRRR